MSPPTTTEGRATTMQQTTTGKTTSQSTTETTTATTTTVPTTPTTTKPEAPCLDIMVDQCNDDTRKVIASFAGTLSIDECESLINEHPICTLNECNSYIYYKNTATCVLVEDKYDSYLSECGTFGAGADSVENCLSSNSNYPDPCKVRPYVYI